MRSRERKSIAAALGLLETDAIAWGGLASDSNVRLADHQSLGLDQPADMENHRARPFGLYSFSQAARTRVPEIGYEENFATAAAPGIRAIAFRARECQGAATN